MESELVRDIFEIVARWDVRPGDLELDVAEAVITRLTSAQRDAIDKLRRLGIGIAIDHFGAEFSSLDYMRSYRVNRLKMASSMMTEAEADSGHGAVIRAILSLAHELGVEVVAQGVTTETQRRLLMGAAEHTKVRSFYYGPAAPANEVTWMLQAGLQLDVTSQAS
jgi:EAL domain-containing protein (putative c-di-GMP-specific phosphodiesterase class I)